MIDWKKLEQKPYKPLATAARIAGAEGSVLLKNENNVLPINKDSVVSIFGRTQVDYFTSGFGSGGSVHTEYTVNILDGIKNNPNITVYDEVSKLYIEWSKNNQTDDIKQWCNTTWTMPEMPLTEEIVKSARENSDVALIVIGRMAGESRDFLAEKSGLLLDDTEEEMLSLVSKYFDKTCVILNVSGIIDMKFVAKYDIKSVLYVWHGGMEGGNSVADILSGNITPCGKLTDTIAKDISLYPSTKNFGDEVKNIYQEDIYVGYRYFETFAKDDVLYPFGFGLSYTDFDINVDSVVEKNNSIVINATVTNIGDFSGREIVEVYFEAPQGLLGKSSRELCSFSKTELLKPNEKEQIELSFDINSMCAYDDSGITGNKSCYVLESGEYNIYLGKDVRSAKKIYAHNIDNTIVTEKLTEALAPNISFDVIKPKNVDGKLEVSYVPVHTRSVDYKARVKENLPKEISQTGDLGIKLNDVKIGKNSMEEFVAQLSDEDLIWLVKGEGMCSMKVRPGNAGAIGGTNLRLNDFGIPVIPAHDGPSGVRMDNDECATSLPCGTAIACTWDVKVPQNLYSMVSIELCTHKIDILLGAGINIHRSPLNGRNFEYLSEDPYITGKMAAGLIRGMNEYGNASTLKHFIANSQEFNRNFVNSVLSERAAREIYLKGFEYAVKEGNAKVIMTTYNPTNDFLTCNNYELNTIILRNEWGFKGFVMTDWWPSLKKDENGVMDLSDMVEAQNDVYMLTTDIGNFKDNLAESLKNGRITRGQLQRNVINIFNFLINTHTFEYFVENDVKLEESLVKELDSLKTVEKVDVVKNDVPFELKLSDGRYLLCINYSSPFNELTQFVTQFRYKKKNIATFTINGTNGETTTIYKDVKLNYGLDENKVNTDLQLGFGENLIKINSIEFKKQ